MISREEARAIVRGLDPLKVVRRAYRAAARGTDGGNPPGSPPGVPSGESLAVVVLDLEDGTVRVEGGVLAGASSRSRPGALVVLAFADADLVGHVRRRFGAGCEVAPSLEVLEECLVGAAAASGVGVDWVRFEGQLALAYGEAHGGCGVDFEPDEYGDAAHKDGRGRA